MDLDIIVCENVVLPISWGQFKRRRYSRNLNISIFVQWIKKILNLSIQIITAA